MGKDKGSIVLNEKPLILHVLDTLNHQINELYIVVNDSKRQDQYQTIINHTQYTYKITYLTDEEKNIGPISAIKTGLKNIKNTHALILPCDAPHIQKQFINNIYQEQKNNTNYDAIIPYTPQTNKTQQLHAIYSKKTIPIIEKQIKNNNYKIKQIFTKIKTKYIEEKKLDPTLKSYKNLNKPEDLI